MLGKAKGSAYAEEPRTTVGTLIGEGAVFNGNLTAPETVRVDGIINGDCTCEKKLILGVEGQIKGNIRAQSALISGKVDGDITVDGKMELLSTGRVVGDVTARSLVIDEDAFFDGRCTMTPGNTNHVGAAGGGKTAADAKNPDESRNHSGPDKAESGKGNGK